VTAASASIRTAERPVCPVCDGAGDVAFAALTDRWFGAPGEWRMRRCVRSGCGTVWADPAIVPDELGRAYESYYTHTASRHSTIVYRAYRGMARAWLARELGYGVPSLAALAGLVFDSARREELRHSILYLGAPAGRVCDVGCGEGARLERMAELGWTGTGVEPDGRAAHLARERGLDVREGTLAGQRFDTGSFDAVTMAHVIEHVPDPLETLVEARRVLAPGGRLAIATPNADSLGARRWGAAWRGLEPPRHLQVFTPASLLALTRRAGFDNAHARTSARMAAVIHLESETGRCATGGATFPGRLRAQALQFAEAERRALASDPDAGEEILLGAGV
jgi:2-polyprenyl-3-methyl-5-hydroxy-6-metoxy-1,4-benzoquinol methylase